VPVVGILGSPTADSYVPRIAIFMQELKEAGFVEGQTMAIEQRWANDQYDRLPAMATELVNARVALIAAFGNNLAARAAKNATSTIPIVFQMGADPVQARLVDGLSRPGGNITGVTSLASDQIQKRLQLLHDAVPAAKVIGLLLNPDNLGAPSSGRTALELVQAAARSWGITIEIAQVRDTDNFDAAIASLTDRKIGALATGSDALFNSGAGRLIALAARYGLPMISGSSSSTRDGGLMSYSANIPDLDRSVGRYTGRILKGEKPGDLPVVLPTKFEFVINLKTAKALGLTIPPGVLAIVDEVIE
jgi:putative tryptophan/tyrosine transport system substrate-binding protein